MPRRTRPSVLSGAAAAAAAVVAALSQAAPARAADLMRTMEGQPDLRVFTQLARASGADREIASHRNIMVLAPVDEALDERLRQTLAANPAAARRFVLDHVVATAFPFGQSLDGSLGMFRTLGGAPVELRSRGSQPGLANERSEPVAINIRADNGLLHKMDAPIVGVSGAGAARNLPGNPDARPQNPGGIDNRPQQSSR